MCRDHHQHSELFQDINRIHDGKYHPCPSMICVIIDNILTFPQHKLVRVLCYTLLSNICSPLPWSIAIFYVKNVVRILPPLENSWYKWCFSPSPFPLGPRVIYNRNAEKWTMICEFKTSSNPIACKLWMIVSFFMCWLLTHHSNIDHVT